MGYFDKMLVAICITALLLLPGGAFAADESVAEKNVDWVQVTAKADWQARDSQGELVYDNTLWIFGGWFASDEAPPRDVWNSADGKHWNLVEKSAPWIHSGLSMSLSFNNKMWFMGGWYNGRLRGHSASNEVWSSTDGVKWEQTTNNAGWPPRLWWTVKYEEIYPKNYADGRALWKGLGKYFRYYNEERKHSALDKRTQLRYF